MNDFKLVTVCDYNIESVFRQYIFNLSYSYRAKCYLQACKYRGKKANKRKKVLIFSNYRKTYAFVLYLTRYCIFDIQTGTVFCLSLSDLESTLWRIFGYIKYIISFENQYGGKQIYSNLDYLTVDHNIIGYIKMSIKGDMQAFTDSDYTLDSIN